jgi:hypothetical protein
VFIFSALNQQWLLSTTDYKWLTFKWRNSHSTVYFNCEMCRVNTLLLLWAFMATYWMKLLKVVVVLLHFVNNLITQNLYLLIYLFLLYPQHTPLQSVILDDNIIIHFCYKFSFKTLRLNDLHFPGPLSLFSKWIVSGSYWLVRF